MTENKLDLERQFQAAMDAAKALDAKAFHAAMKAAQDEFNGKLSAINADKFKQTKKEVTLQIEEYLEDASNELAKAIKLSEDTGIPFESYIRELVRSSIYVPKSFFTVWKDQLDSLKEIDYRYSGWDY